MLSDLANHPLPRCTKWCRVYAFHHPQRWYVRSKDIQQPTEPVALFVRGRDREVIVLIADQYLLGLQR